VFLFDTNSLLIDLNVILSMLVWVNLSLTLIEHSSLSASSHSWKFTDTA